MVVAASARHGRTMTPSEVCLERNFAYFSRHSTWHGGRGAWTIFKEFLIVIGGSITDLATTILRKGQILIQTSFGIPLSSRNGVASSAHVQTTLPAVRSLANGKTGIVLADRFNHPGTRIMSDVHLAPITGHLNRLLNRSIVGYSSYVNSSITTTIGNVDGNRMTLLRGIHFCTKRRTGSPSFTGTLTTGTSLCIGSTFNATRHTRTSARNIAGCLDPSITKCLVRGRLRCLRTTVRGPRHPLTTVVNNSGISDGVNIVRALLSGMSGLLVNNNVVFAFCGTHNLDINNSLMRRSGLRLTGTLRTGTGRGNISLLLPASIIMTSGFTPSTGTRAIDISTVPSN